MPTLSSHCNLFSQDSQCSTTQCLLSSSTLFVSGSIGSQCSFLADVSFWADLGFSTNPWSEIVLKASEKGCASQHEEISSLISNLHNAECGNILALLHLRTVLSTDSQTEVLDFHFLHAFSFLSECADLHPSTHTGSYLFLPLRTLEIAYI